MAHTFTTTVVSNDGTFAAELISLPQYFDVERARGPLPPDAPTRFSQLAEALDAGLGPAVPEASMRDMLMQIAYEAGAGRRADADAVREVIDVILYEHVVIVEESPAFGTTLIALLSQGAPAYVLIVEGKPLLALATEAGLIILWFVSGPVIGVREGIRDGAREATKAVSAELLERWLRERFSRRRRRRK